MNNIYNGIFDQDEVNRLEQFSGFTFWKVEDRWSQTGYTIYAKHESWNNSQRTTASSAFDMYMSLHITRMAGY
jgi:hypothetical protein